MSDTSVRDRCPSTNGSNGDHTGHDQRGRFAKGNPGGPGNPFGRQVAALRAGLLACTTQQDVQDVMAALLVQAKKGNVAAVRLFFAYTIGKPGETVDPDRVDAEESRTQNGARYAE